MLILGRSQHAASELRGTAERAIGRRASRGGRLLAAGAGIGLGAAASYLLDPELGRGRRARLADQAMAAFRHLMHRAGQIGRLQAGRLEGVAESLRHRGDAPPSLDDASLAQKVETELFRNRKVPKGAINVNVEHGTVVLRGEVDDQSLSERIEASAAKVEGVESVRNLLHLPGERAAAR